MFPARDSVNLSGAEPFGHLLESAPSKISLGISHKGKMKAEGGIKALTLVQSVHGDQVMLPQLILA